MVRELGLKWCVRHSHIRFRLALAWVLLLPGRRSLLTNSGFVAGILLSFGSCIFSRLVRSFLSFMFLLCESIRDLMFGMQVYDSFSLFLLKIGLKGCHGSIRPLFERIAFPGLLLLSSRTEG